MTDNQKIIVRKNSTMLAQEAITLFHETAKDSIARWGRFVVAISGGATPVRTYREPGRRALPFNTSMG